MAGKPAQQRERDTVKESRDGPAIRKGGEVQDEFIARLDSILRGDLSEPIDESEANQLLEAIRNMPKRVDDLTADFADEMGKAFLHADLLGRAQVADVLNDADEIAQFAAPTALAGDFTPDEAFAWISRQISISRAAFDQLYEELRRNAFTVARAANIQQIEAMRSFIEKQLIGAPGAPAPVLDKRAFIAKFKDQFSEPHLETVFRTNVHSNFEAGKREMLLNPANRSFVKYLRIVTARDFRVRDEHAPLHGFTAPPDDPIWNRVYPPFGYNCRCTVVGVSDRAAERRGITASPSNHSAYSFTPDFSPPTRALRSQISSELRQKADRKEQEVRR